VIENELAPIDPFASTGLGNFDSTNLSLNSFEECEDDLRWWRGYN